MTNTKRKPGRPPVPPERRVHRTCVGLRPRHWNWLRKQPEGISATLRRLVDRAAGFDGPDA